MRISDWSSDVCSSDLTPVLHDITPAGGFGGSGSHQLADAFGDDAFRYLPPGVEGYAGDLRRKYGRRCFRLADDHLPAAEHLTVLPQHTLHSNRLYNKIKFAERPGHHAPATERRCNSGEAVGNSLARTRAPR